MVEEKYFVSKIFFLILKYQKESTGNNLNYSLVQCFITFLIRVFLLAFTKNGSQYDGNK